MAETDNIIGVRRRGEGPGPEIMGASTLTGDAVEDLSGQTIGRIREIMLDVPAGRIAYAVLAFEPSSSGQGKLFAVPWPALRLDAQRRRFVIEADRQRLEQAPGFDPQHWPTLAEPTWTSRLYRHYGLEPYHEE
jgi:hypothetical protein